MQDELPNMCFRVEEGFGLGPITIEYRAIRLPDGSRIRYPGLEEKDGEYTYAGRGTSRLKVYGGLLAENVVQGIARCIVFDQALRIQSIVRPLGGRIVMTVHDEVVAMAPGEHDKAVLAAALEEMHTLPSWCEGLPLAATGGIGQNYGEAK
jgi:hypothetical protein